MLVQYLLLVLLIVSPLLIAFLVGRAVARWHIHHE